MGHSTIDLTARIYTHRTEKSFNDAKRLLNLHTNLHTYDVFDIRENR